MNEGVPIAIVIIIIVVVLIFALLAAIMNGIAMQHLMQREEYDGNWFWQGFLFGPFAFLGASERGDRGKADYPDYIMEAIRKATDEHNLANGGWRCESCGKVNPPATGTCDCGKSRFASVEKKD